jgi:hypothetical protein
LKASAKSVANIIANDKEIKQITEITGISEKRVGEVKKIAEELSLELETNKDMSGWEKIGNVIFEYEILDIIERIRSAEEMKLVATFYQDLYTNGNDLYTDLKKELTDEIFGFDPKKIKFLEALY